MNVKRFWSKVDKRGPDECWPWIGGKFWDGYGWFSVSGAKKKAHRVAFFLEHGHWPEPCCCHRCDNPACVNPAHLFEGTHAENMRDREQKGRGVSGKGSQNPRALLDEKSVAAIKTLLSARVSQASIARQFGVTAGTIAHIRHGRSWAHV